MDKINRIANILRRTVVVGLLVGMLWLTGLPTSIAQAAYAPGAPENPSEKQKTLYEGKRNFVDGGNQAQPRRDPMVRKIQDDAHRIDSERPKTFGEWNREARETEDAPGDRLERIAKESGEAVKEFGEMYPDTAERSGRALD
jgi:hypothetical protein